MKEKKVNKTTVTNSATKASAKKDIVGDSIKMYQTALPSIQRISGAKAKKLVDELSYAVNAYLKGKEVPISEIKKMNKEVHDFQSMVVANEKKPAEKSKIVKNDKKTTASATPAETKPKDLKKPSGDDKTVKKPKKVKSKPANTEIKPVVDKENDENASVLKFPDVLTFGSGKNTLKYEKVEVKDLQSLAKLLETSDVVTANYWNPVQIKQYYYAGFYTPKYLRSVGKFDYDLDIAAITYVDDDFDFFEARSIVTKARYEYLAENVIPAENGIRYTASIPYAFYKLVEAK